MKRTCDLGVVVAKNHLTKATDQSELCQPALQAVINE